MAQRTRRGSRPGPREQAARTAFGQWLQQLRQERGIGVRELAERIGRGITYIDGLETGRWQSPSVQSLVEIARVLGVSPCEVIGRYFGFDWRQDATQAGPGDW